MRTLWEHNKRFLMQQLMWLPTFSPSFRFYMKLGKQKRKRTKLQRLWGSIPCLLIPWLLKSPRHQQAWYWLSRTDSMYCCSRVNFTYLGHACSKIQFKMQIYLCNFSQNSSYSKSTYKVVVHVVGTRKMLHGLVRVSFTQLTQILDGVFLSGQLPLNDVFQT